GIGGSVGLLVLIISAFQLNLQAYGLWKEADKSAADVEGKLAEIRLILDQLSTTPNVPRPGSIMEQGTANGSADPEAPPRTREERIDSTETEDQPTQENRR